MSSMNLIEKLMSPLPHDLSNTIIHDNLNQYIERSTKTMTFQ